jgi:hypothetical protein
MDGLDICIAVGWVIALGWIAWIVVRPQNEGRK